MTSIEFKVFYQIIDEMILCRRQIVNSYWNNPAGINSRKLNLIYDELCRYIFDRNKCNLKLESGDKISIDLSYEVEELKKDIEFLYSDNKLNELLVILHPTFENDVNSLCEWLQGKKVRNFITDRDGTVNNYCGRYNTSVQSVYNSVFLTNYARTVKNSVILTSAPLLNKGIVDISINPQGIFHYAGSKGRQYLSNSNIYGEYAILEEQKEMLGKLSTSLENLLKQKDNQIFTLIGSGFQIKFGEITIARQDVYESISEDRSIVLLNKVRDIVSDLDPEGKYFRVEDTGNDIEVPLTVGKGAVLKDFDKGDGLEFLDRELGLNMSGGGNLICGDTRADIAMVKYAMSVSPETSSIFVTTDEEIKKSVKDICPSSFFVSSPDVLVTALNRYAIS